MKIEVGKKYKVNNNRVKFALIVAKAPNDDIYYAELPYDDRGDFFCKYTIEGKAISKNKDDNNDWDLVEEIYED